MAIHVAEVLVPGSDSFQGTIDEILEGITHPDDDVVVIESPIEVESFAPPVDWARETPREIYVNYQASSAARFRGRAAERTRPVEG